MPSKSRRFERCIRAVKGRSRVDDPAAVCATSLRRTGWRPGAKNPADAAADLSAAFHGRPPQEQVVVDEDLHEHEHLAGLGELTVLELEDGTTLEDFDGALLASNEDGTQLFIRGGSQAVSLRRFQEVDRSKELVVLGQVARIVYVTEKMHLEKADRKRGPYEHELGEESGQLPYLVYDTVNERLSFAGGSYHVQDVGIVD